MPFELFTGGSFTAVIDGIRLETCAIYTVLVDPSTFQGHLFNDLVMPLVQNLVTSLDSSFDDLTPIVLEQDEITGPFKLDEGMAFTIQSADERFLIAMGIQLERLYNLVRVTVALFPVPQPQTIYSPPATQTQPDSRIVEQTPWPEVTIETGTIPGEYYSQEYLSLSDKTGQRLLEVTEFRITNIDFYNFDGEYPLELVIQTWSGGNGCCFETYIYSYEGGLKEIYRESAIVEIRDIDGDGKHELFHHSAVYLGDLPRCCYPSFKSVEAWDGKSFVDQTFLYPEFAEADREASRTTLIEGLANGSAVDQYSGAMGFFANSVILGQGDSAWGWLEQNVPADVIDWLMPHKETIEQNFSRVSDQ